MQKIGPPRGYVKEILEKRSSEVVDVREHKARNGDRLLQAFFETESGKLAALARGHISCLDVVYTVEGMNEPDVVSAGSDASDEDIEFSSIEHFMAYLDGIIRRTNTVKKAIMSGKISIAFSSLRSSTQYVTVA